MTTPRLQALRKSMTDRGLDAVLIRSTDPFLNEYVPPEQSTRAYLTGFRGSVGDAIVTQDQALLFVDGRYTLQATKEAVGFTVVTCKMTDTIESTWQDALAGLGIKNLGVETDRVPADLYQSMEKRAAAAHVDLVETVPSLIELPASDAADVRIWQVDPKLCGGSAKERAARAWPKMQALEIDGYLSIPLDEIAWLTNLRGDGFPYQATFRAQAIVQKDGVLLANFEAQNPSVEAGVTLGTDLSEMVKDGACIGYSKRATPEYIRRRLAARCTLVEVESPILKMRTEKTTAELAHMADAFARADTVVAAAQRWLAQAVMGGEHITEKVVVDKVSELFMASGAFGLSFAVIAAAGKNGAVIHYGTPDQKTALQKGELFLLDTGAYYDGGYATDLTRTFIIGDGAAGDKARRVFTTVLQGAIAGMSARLPIGTTGAQLDAIVRNPIWRAGLDYGHGTGHGVGVNVHEFPPRAAPGVSAELKIGHVFSIEPGYYHKDFGGVRIENLCTLVADDVEGFMRVKPLTFSPFDERLIDDDRLSAQERAFLAWFKEGARLGGAERLAFRLPPVAHEVR